MQIEILHPVSYGIGNELHTFSRGLHDMKDALAMEFLKLKDDATGQPIARLPEDKSAVAQGSVSVAGHGGVNLTPLRDRK
jgi:hypothetical protein